MGEALGRQLVGGDVVVLDGPLGAGKTTFTQGLARGLGVTAPVTSPTFVLARHQRPDPAGPRPDGPWLVHVDAYRVGGALEWDDLDLDSDVDRSVVVVEWGHGLAERLADRWVAVRLTRAAGDGTSDGEARTLEVSLEGTAPGPEHAPGRRVDLDLLPGRVPAPEGSDP
ncbi:tRNA (adenosine(37)-N6)-threonylcarbamoyltransferase complex ATPase subunit type 1 TsaE [Aquipuribacter nitratireducens]|uniref:tRNA threonylcarbamoyladenosine biosynthesis protein TsaE n=1 Tax=Aquipuribacter nitratireducens TaxID=650104 RepID=A0ABW0GJR7_9MICO